MKWSVSKLEERIYPQVFNKRYYRIWDLLSIILISIYTNKLAGENISIHLNADYIKIIKYILSAYCIISFVLLYYSLLDLDKDIQDRISKNYIDNYDSTFKTHLFHDRVKIRFYLISIFISLFIFWCV